MSIVGRAFVVALVVSVAVTGGIVLTGSTAATDGDAVQRVAAQQNATAEERNETPSHRNPDDYAENGDLEGVEGWLTDRLAGQLGDGAIQLSEGEYELAGEYVDEEYRERLDQYVDVAGETDGEGSEDEFEAAGETQSELAETVREYRETKAEYEAAREAGNEERARELARELETLADEIESLGGSVREHYDEIEAATGADLSEPDAAIETVTGDVRAEQAAVRDRQFEETSLTLVPERETISFLEPLVATGRLRTADGEPIANEAVRLDVGNHTRRVTTDSDGEFTLEYRPTDEPLSTDELEVRYVPAARSTYLGDGTTVGVSIEQVEPTVALDETPAELAYGDRAAVTGSLTADGVDVDGVSAAVIVDGERIGTAPVRDGAFDSRITLPAAVEDGDRELTVRLPFEDRALAGTAAETNVTVRETGTELSVEGSSTDEREITVTGTLEGAGGAGVEGEPVRIRIDGTTVGTLTTDADGTFGDAVSVPDSVSRGEPTVAAVYDGRGANLEPARAHAVVTIGGSSGADGSSSTSIRLAGGVIVAVAVGVGVWWFRRSGGESTDDPAGDRGSTADEATTFAQPSEPSPDTVTPLLERASERLSSGRPDDAARTGYAAVRRALGSRIDERTALTHWEFYRTYRSDETTDAELLRDVTNGYERAAYGREGVSSDEAATVIAKARRLCGLEDRAEESAPADD